MTENKYHTTCPTTIAAAQHRKRGNRLRSQCDLFSTDLRLIRGEKSGNVFFNK